MLAEYLLSPLMTLLCMAPQIFCIPPLLRRAYTQPDANDNDQDEGLELNS